MQGSGDFWKERVEKNISHKSLTLRSNQHNFSNNYSLLSTTTYLLRSDPVLVGVAGPLLAGGGAAGLVCPRLEHILTHMTSIFVPLLHRKKLTKPFGDLMNVICACSPVEVIDNLLDVARGRRRPPRRRTGDPVPDGDVGPAAVGQGAGAIGGRLAGSGDLSKTAGFW